MENNTKNKTDTTSLNDMDTIEFVDISLEDDFDTKTLKTKKKPKKHKKLFFLFVFVIFLGGFLALFASKQPHDKNLSPTDNEVENPDDWGTDTDIFHVGAQNPLLNMDLAFLKLEQGNKNVVYSPLSIKYALLMLQAGADGSTKEQIDALLNGYHVKKYPTNQNMSFANALFIKDSYRNVINTSYENNLAQKYNASLVFDDFTSSNFLNSWIEKKTLGFVKNLVGDIQSDFIFASSLAIDMEWKNLIQPSYGYHASYPHENVELSISNADFNHVETLLFNRSMQVKALEFGSVINRYDIVSDLGNDAIFNTVQEEYRKWCMEKYSNSTSCNDDSINYYVDNFINELNSNYERMDTTTDYMFYIDDNVKAFAKDLKEYNGMTLQYIGIMPKDKTVNDYIASVDVDAINSIINHLKPIELENFAQGKVTKIIGKIPLFQFDYAINLEEGLKSIGVKDLFNSNANLSKITSDVMNIDVLHKATIQFSNQGITQDTVESEETKNNEVSQFEYLYDVPVEIIDMTFDKPYLFLIRDKNSGEVWFVGKVYEPLKSE